MKTKSKLVEKHSEIWTLMRLSPGATDELNRIVVDLSSLLKQDRRERATTGAPEPEILRTDRPLTREEFLERHQYRFESLGVSQATGVELLGAADFVWKALHDADVPAEQRETAETIQKMMLALGGPPPCCDDSMLDRSGRGAPCS